MNNNYPSFECEIDLNDTLDDLYTIGNSVVHMCVYSKLVSKHIKLNTSRK